MNDLVETLRKFGKWADKDLTKPTFEEFIIWLSLDKDLDGVLPEEQEES